MKDTEQGTSTDYLTKYPLRYFIKTPSIALDAATLIAF